MDHDEQADIKKNGGGIVLCWTKGRMDSGDPPLHLRLVQVKVGKTNMWMLTNVLDRKRLSIKQIPDAQQHDRAQYSPKQRSLAETMRALRKCMRNLNSISDPQDGPLHWLAAALVKQYNNRTDKRARYRPKNTDKKPLGDPVIRKMNSQERRRLNEINASQAA